MEMWAREDSGGWTTWNHVAEGLDALAAGTFTAVLLVVTGEPADDRATLPVIRLAKRLSPAPVALMVASPHPSAAWYASTRDAGADQALAVSTEPGAVATAPPLEGSAEIGETLCPALHVLHTKGATLSVCGRHHDRLVLARHHFDRWCLGTKECCPHWRGGSPLGQRSRPRALEVGAPGDGIEAGSAGGI